MLKTITDRTEILKRKHQLAIKQVDALHTALYKLEQSHQASPNYPHIRLAAVRAFELTFHALCSYLAERVGMIYEVEQPEFSAGLIFNKALKDTLFSDEDYISCLELIAVYSVTGEVFDGDMAEETCHDLIELFPIMCTVAQYNPEDIHS